MKSVFVCLCVCLSGGVGEISQSGMKIKILQIFFVVEYIVRDNLIRCFNINMNLVLGTIIKATPDDVNLLRHMESFIEIYSLGSMNMVPRQHVENH